MKKSKIFIPIFWTVSARWFHEKYMSAIKNIIFISIVLCLASVSLVYGGYLITTVAGDGSAGYSGDGGSAVSAQLNGPSGVAVDTAGNIYIADYSNHLIRKVNTSGTISTFAGTGTAGFSGDGGPATSSKLKYPIKVAVDASGNVYICGDHRVRKVNTSGTISTFAGTGTAGFSGDGGSASAAQLNSPSGLAVDVSGNIYIADTWNDRIRVVNSSGTISTFAGTGTAGFSGDGGIASAAQLNWPSGVAVDTSGNVYITDLHNNRIRKVNASGIISTFAGTGTAGFSGNGGSASAAQLNNPYGLAVDTLGNVYFSDLNHCVRKVNTSGIISNFAGGGSSGLGDGGSATATQLYYPYGLTVDASGNLYIADNDDNRIRKVYFAQTGIISGKVTKSDGTTPVSGALIEVLKSGVVNSSAISDTSGNYSIMIKTGTYDVRASSTGYQSHIGTGYAVTNGLTLTVNFSLTEAQTGTLSGTVTASNGSAIANALIKIYQGSVLVDEVYSNSTGIYNFSLAVGTYDMDVSKTGYQTATRTGVLISNNQITSVNVSLFETAQAKPQAGNQTTLGDNLFRPSSGGTCKIGFTVAQAGGITIKIYDLMGRQVRNAIDNTNYTAGNYQWDWNGKDDNGSIVPSGIYLMYFKSPGGTEKRKIGVK